MNSNLGAVLRDLRREKDISIVALTAKMGVSQAYISKLERGLIRPTKEQLETLYRFIKEE